MIGQRIEAAIKLLLYGVGILFVLAVLGGCMDVATKAALDAMRKQTTIALKQSEDAGKIARAQATTRPVEHPLEWTDALISETKGPLVWLRNITFALTLGCGGAWVASVFLATSIGPLLALIGKLGVAVCGVICGGSALTLAALPWTPWIILTCFLLLLAIFLLYLSRHGWKIGQLFSLHQENKATIRKVASQVLPPGSPGNPVVTVEPGSQGAPISGS